MQTVRSSVLQLVSEGSTLILAISSCQTFNKLLRKKKINLDSQSNQIIELKKLRVKMELE